MDLVIIMFIDINILIDSRKVDYDYKIKDGRLYISFKIEPNKKKLNIHYDSNIYDDFKVETGDFKDKDGYLEIDLTKNNLNFFEFSMKANFKYYVKLVYDQVQHNYKKEELIEMLKSLYELNKEKEVLDRIKVLEELNIEDKFLYYEIDHFIPWSFVMNDELWNLMPMDSSLNSAKSNRLPKWDPFFSRFADNQYLLYRLINEKPGIRKLYDHCYKDNLHCIWAGQELYRIGLNFCIGGGI